VADNIAIDVDNVFFTYPDGHAVLKGVSCQIKHGEKVALIGPNGAGKSTFMSLLNGVSLASGGKVSIDGLEVNKENLVDIRRRIGIVFQDPDDQLFCPTVYDDVAFGPLNLGLAKDEVDARVAESLSLVGLEGFDERSSYHLSFGERKRLALATVLSYRPEILVFDEPSTNMDPLNRRKLINWLKSSDKTILLCTHDLDIALEVCDRCFLLANGEMVADDVASKMLYDKELLEENNLELPLALMTHELLHDILHEKDMDEDHRFIIGEFLHAHRHAHGPDGHVHFHLHSHPHDSDHVHDDSETVHSHHLHAGEHGEIVHVHHDHSHENKESEQADAQDKTTK